MPKATPAKSRTRMSPEARREQLLQAAMELFVSLPLEQVTVDAVASAAGVSRGLVFHYFPTVRDLHLNCLDAAANALFGSVAAAVASDESDDPVRAGIDAFVSYIEQQPLTYTALSSLAVNDPDVGTVFDDMRLQFAEFVVSQPAVRKHPLARSFAIGWVAMFEAVVQSWLVDQPTSRDVLIDELRHSAKALLG